MDPNFWLERWQKHEIGFHQPKVQPALEKHWPLLGLEPRTTVLVPLAGKSLDMDWLAARGHTVIGVELSEIAIDEFFSERDIKPDVREIGAFTVKSWGNIALWCGDFFTLSQSILPRIDAVYDRAALVAMPPELQPRYVATLAAVVPEDTQILLIGLDYNEQEMQGPPFAVPQSRVRALFENQFDVELRDVRDGLTKTEHLAKRGITRLEEATYVMSRRA